MSYSPYRSKPVTTTSSRRKVPIPSKSAWELLQEQQQQQSTSTPYLLHPTLPLHIGGVTELVGPAGSGKTQLCISAACDVLLSSENNANNNSVLYVMLAQDRSGATAWRLQGMLQARQRQSQTQNTTMELQPLLRRFWMRSIRNQDELLELVHSELPPFLQKQHSKRSSPVRLVVFDGLAHLFRVAENYMERSSTFFELSSRLKQLSLEYQVSILCTNQVTSRIIIPSSDGRSSLYNTDNHLQPALGLSWAQCCNASFMIQRNNNNKRRRLVPQRSPSLDRRTHSVVFELQAQGGVVVVTTEEEDDETNNTKEDGTTMILP